MRVHGPSALRAATQINGRRLNTLHHGGTDGGILRDAHSKLVEVYGAASPGAVYELVLLPHISVETLHITLVPSLLRLSRSDMGRKSVNGRPPVLDKDVIFGVRYHA